MGENEPLNVTKGRDRERGKEEDVRKFQEVEKRREENDEEEAPVTCI